MPPDRQWPRIRWQMADDRIVLDLLRVQQTISPFPDHWTETGDDVH